MMVEKDLISVVVPIYKVEKYLDKCINSILNQSYTNLDIILVDDESPDNCGKIIEGYKSKDRRIKTLHQKNGGLSDARNNGMKLAEGKYILFIDSDDWIESNMIETLYKNIIKYKAHISVCEFLEEDDSGTVLSKKEYDDNILVFNNKEAIKNLIKQENLTNHAWNKLYALSLFDEVKYPKGQLMEDISTTYRLIEHSNNIVYQNTMLYHYLQRGSSILGNVTEERINAQENAIFERNKYLKEKYPNYAKEIDMDNLLNVKTLYYLAVMSNCKALYNSNNYKIYYEKYKKIYKELKNEVPNKDKISMNLFYTNRNLYKIYVKLKKIRSRINDKKDN